MARPTVPSKLKRMRLDRNESLATVAKAIGCSEPLLSNAERGVQELGQKFATALSSYYNVTLNGLRDAWLDARADYLSERLEQVEQEQRSLKAARRRRAALART